MKLKYWIHIIAILLVGLITYLTYYYLNKNLNSKTNEMKSLVEMPINDSLKKLQLQEQQINSITKNDTNNNDMTVAFIGGIFSLVLMMASIIWNPRLIEIGHKVDTLHKQNKEEHNDINNSIKIFQARVDTELALRTVMNHCLESTPKELSKLITNGGELFIDFALEIMNSKFDYTIMHSVEIKLQQSKEKAMLSFSVFGDDYLAQFKTFQTMAFDNFIKELTEIVNDEISNSKLNKFRILCEGFLYKKLNAIVRIYYETYQNNHKSIIP